MPQAVSAELRRVTERWRQLPLAQAQARMPLVRALLDDLAGASGPVPDLGPAVVADQLVVLVHDRCAAGPPEGLEEQLAAVRRGLSAPHAV